MADGVELGSALAVGVVVDGGVGVGVGVVVGTGGVGGDVGGAVGSALGGISVVVGGAGAGEQLMEAARRSTAMNRVVPLVNR